MDVERAVLGGLLCVGDRMPDVLAIGLRAPDFSVDLHRQLFALFEKMHREDIPIEPLLVEMEAGKAGFGSAVDTRYTSRLIASIDMVDFLLHYARLVRRAARMRRLGRAGQAIEGYALDLDDPDEAVTRSLALLQQVDADEPTGLESLAGMPWADEQITALETGVKTPGIERVLTGLETMDRECPLVPRELTILASAPNQGKSALCLDIARRVARKQLVMQTGKWVYFFSLEMDKEGVQRRLLAAESELSLTMLRNGEMDRTHLTALKTGKQRAEHLPLLLDATRSQAIAQVCAKAQRHARRQPPALILVDYLQEASDDKLRDERSDQRLGRIAKYLRKLTADLKVPVVLVSSLKRFEGEPSLNDLRDSGELEFIADNVLMLYRPDRDQPDSELGRVCKLSDYEVAVKVSVEKGRNCASGTFFWLKYNMSKQTFDWLPFNQWPRVEKSSSRKRT